MAWSGFLYFNRLSFCFRGTHAGWHASPRANSDPPLWFLPAPNPRLARSLSGEGCCCLASYEEDFGDAGGFFGDDGFPLASGLRSFLRSCAAPFSLRAGFRWMRCWDTCCAFFSNPSAFRCGCSCAGAFVSNPRAFRCGSPAVFTAASLARCSDTCCAFFSNSLAFRCDSSWAFVPDSFARGCDSA